MKGVFKCAMEDDERRFMSVKRSSLGMPMCTPINIQETQASKLGDAPGASPSSSTIISLSLVALYFYHFMRYVLCLERLALYFSRFVFALFAVVKSYIPAYLIFFVGEIHAPFELELLIGFACLFS